MSIISFVRRHSFIASFMAVLLILASIIAARSVASQESPVAPPSQRKVSTVPASTFREGYSTVSFTGVVESSGQADLKSQISAPVASIHFSIGDSVSAGQVIMELSNTDLRAQLAQAEAALSLAEGQRYTGSVSLESARLAAIDRIRDAYVKGYDAVYTQADPLLYNYNGQGARMSEFVSDRELSDRITSVRLDMNTVIPQWKIVVDNLSPDSDESRIIDAIELSRRNLVSIDGLLGDISQALNDALRSSNPEFSAFLTNWKTVISTTRTAVSGSASALTAAEASLTNAQASQGTTSQAQVSASRAGVANLEAQFSKTIIRSPISGRVASLPLRVGELASPGQLVATVVGESGQEIRTFASGEDIDRIKVGTPVNIEGNISGTVKSVAPSVNTMNRKVEVIISVNGRSGSSLTVGRSVQGTIQAEGAPTLPSDGTKAMYLLPIQNVKIIPGDAYVFTVDENSRLKRNPVVIGQIRGDFVEIQSGITDAMTIVTPVYELEEGQEVSVQ